MERPLKDVTENALNALHKAIEKRTGLICDDYRVETGSGCDVCALGAMGDTYQEAVHECIRCGLLRDGSIAFSDALTSSGYSVSVLNFGHDIGPLDKVTPQKRREFMLRHIVEELRQREKSLPVKTNKYQEVK